MSLEVQVFRFRRHEGLMFVRVLGGRTPGGGGGETLGTGELTDRGLGLEVSRRR